eukprot:c6675_g1_i1 orf=40-189(+)
MIWLTSISFTTKHLPSGGLKSTSTPPKDDQVTSVSVHESHPYYTAYAHV